VEFSDYLWSCPTLGKEIFLREFSILCQKVKGPTLFGVTLILLERAVRKVIGGNIGRWSIIFNAIIEHNNLMELQLGNRQYTWSNDHVVPIF
jgi:hypothetical protein